MVTGVWRRFARGFGANMFAQIVFVVVQLVGVPVLLRCWGANLYGEWLILFAIPSYLAITDLGFTQSAANDMTQLVARGALQDALKVFHSLCALVCTCVGIGAVLAIAVIYAAPFDHWWQGSALDGRAAQLVLLIVIVETLIRLLSGISDAGFRSNGDYSISAMIYVLTHFVQNLAIWVVALVGFGPIGAAIAILIIRLIVTPLSYLMLVRRHRWLRVGFSLASAAELRRLTRPAMANLGMPLAQALNIQGMVLVVGAELGAVAVVALSTMRTLTRLIQQLSMAIYNAVEPELSAAFGLGDLKLMQHISLHAMRSAIWISIVAAFGLMLFGGFILRVWTHGAVVLSPGLFAWLLFCSIAYAVWYGCLIPIKAINRHIRLAAIYCVASGAAIVVADLLIRMTGQLSAAGLALALMDGGLAIYCLQQASRAVGMRAVPYFAQAVNAMPTLRLVLEKARAARDR